MSQRNLQSNASGGISSEHYVFKDYKKRKYLDPHTHMKMYAKFVNDKSKVSRRGSVEKVTSVPSRGSNEKSPSGDGMSIKKTDTPVLPKLPESILEKQS